MADDWKARVEAATVRVPSGGGQGVLVPGGLVLTATHCLTLDVNGTAFLASRNLEAVHTSGGAAFRLDVQSADAISDLAVLGEPDNQACSKDCEAFEGWLDTTHSIPLSLAFEAWRRERAALRDVLRFPVHCLAHTGEWIDGVALRTAFSPLAPGIAVDWAAPIRSGTSGGPVVDRDGRLVGVMSSTTEVESGPTSGMLPIAGCALPRWVLERIEEDQNA